MDKYVKQTRFQEWWHGKRYTKEYIESIELKKNDELECSTRKMELLYCGIIDSGCIADKCVHFKKGRVIRTSNAWGFYNVVKSGCKLWGKQ